MPNTANVLHPITTAELSNIVEAESSSARRLLVRGAGTAFDWGGRAHPVDTVLDTSALTGIIRHDPGDMVVRVRAGTSLNVLQAQLAHYGQRVALDPARASLGATLGGLVATADSGPLRHAFGSFRDLVIGITFVLADGTVANSGGQVIKNVAGYDLAKLLHGSLGTLGVIAEVVLRLHPLPHTNVTVAVPSGPAEAIQITQSVIRAAIEPAALEWCEEVLHIRLEGTAIGTEAGAAHVLELVGKGEVLSKTEAEAAWAKIATVSRGDHGDTVLRVSTRPSDLPWLVERLEELVDRHVDLALTSSAGVGLQTLQLRMRDPGTHNAVLNGIRGKLAARNATCIVCRPDGLDPTDATRGQPPAGVEIMRAIKSRFDPDNRLGAGRFAPWF